MAAIRKNLCKEVEKIMGAGHKKEAKFFLDVVFKFIFSSQEIYDQFNEMLEKELNELKGGEKKINCRRIYVDRV